MPYKGDLNPQAHRNLRMGEVISVPDGNSLEKVVATH